MYLSYCVIDHVYGLIDSVFVIQYCEKGDNLISDSEFMSSSFWIIAVSGICLRLYESVGI